MTPERWQQFRESTTTRCARSARAGTNSCARSAAATKRCGRQLGWLLAQPGPSEVLSKCRARPCSARLCWGHFGGRSRILSDSTVSRVSDLLAFFKIRPYPESLSSSTPAASTTISNCISTTYSIGSSRGEGDVGAPTAPRMTRVATFGCNLRMLREQIVGIRRLHQHSSFHCSVRVGTEMSIRRPSHAPPGQRDRRRPGRGRV